MNNKGHSSVVRQWIPIVIGSSVAGILTGWLADEMSLTSAVPIAILGGSAAALAMAFVLERFGSDESS